MTCKNCHNPIEETANYCANCGLNIKTNQLPKVVETGNMTYSAVMAAYLSTDESQLSHHLVSGKGYKVEILALNILL